MMRCKAITEPTAPLLSLETLRLQCEVVAIDTDSDGVESHPDDPLLLGYLEAAVDHAEDFTGRAINLRTWEAALDKFDGDIELPRAPLVELLTFTLSDDSDGAVSTDDYVVDTYGEAALLRPLAGWPQVTEYPNTIKVRFRAGYRGEVDPDSDAPVLPGAIKSAILLTVAHLYANREESTEKAMSSLPLGVDAFLRPKRIRTGMA